MASEILVYVAFGAANRDDSPNQDASTTTLSLNKRKLLNIWSVRSYELRAIPVVASSRSLYAPTAVKEPKQDSSDLLRSSRSEALS